MSLVLNGQRVDNFFFFCSSLCILSWCLHRSLWRCGGLMVSALNSGFRVVRARALAGVIVYKWVPGLASHPGGRSNTPSRFMLRKPELSAGPIGHLGLYKGFFTYFIVLMYSINFILLLYYLPRILVKRGIESTAYFKVKLVVLKANPRQNC